MAANLDNIFRTEITEWRQYLTNLYDRCTPEDEKDEVGRQKAMLELTHAMANCTILSHDTKHFTPDVAQALIKGIIKAHNDAMQVITNKKANP